MGSVQPAYAESFGAARAHLSRRSAAKAEHPTPKLNSEESCSLLLKVALVNLIHHVLCEDRSGPASGAQAFLDQSPFAVEPGLLFDQSAHFRSATAHRLRKRAVPEPLGMLEPGDGDVHFAHVITAIQKMDSSIIIEVLVPDFHADDSCIQTVLDAGPDIYNHNLETVERLTPVVRSRAKYRTSLQVLRRAKELSSDGRGIVTKSGIMLGLGETEPEIFQTMDDLREVGCQVLTMGQYLRPTPNHLPVVEFVTPEQFDLYGEIARKKGFEHVA